MKKKPNPVAKALRNPVCKQRIVNSKKVYKRKLRHPVALFPASLHS
jgi:hypothetical protein